MTFTVTTVALAFYSATGLDVYVSVYIIEYLIITILHSPFNAETQKMINVLSYALFLIFICIVVAKFLQILGASLI